MFRHVLLRNELRPLLRCASIGYRRLGKMSVPSGTRFIFEAGVKLCLCHESVATACVYYHKFFQVMDKKGYNEHLVIMAALNLAAKAMERQVKLSDVVNTCYRCLHPSEAPLEVNDVYWNLKDSVAHYELLLLRAMKFDIYVTLPHSHLLHYLLALSRWVDPHSWTRSRLPVVSLSLLQDSYHTSLPLSHSPHKMATAVLYLAVLCCRLVIPGNSGRSVCKWWEVLCPDSSEADLLEISRQIMSCIYDQSTDTTATNTDTGKTVTDKTLSAMSNKRENKTANRDIMSEKATDVNLESSESIIVGEVTDRKAAGR